MSGDNKKTTGRLGEELVCKLVSGWRVPFPEEKKAICQALSVGSRSFDLVKDTPNGKTALGEVKANTNADGKRGAFHDFTRNEVHAAVAVGEGFYFLFYVDLFHQSVEEQLIDFKALSLLLQVLNQAQQLIARVLPNKTPVGIYAKFALRY